MGNLWCFFVIDFEKNYFLFFICFIRGFFRKVRIYGNGFGREWIVGLIWMKKFMFVINYIIRRGNKVNE